MKDKTLKNIENTISSLANLRTLVRLSKGDFVSKSSIRELAKKLSRIWFEEIEPLLTHSFSLPEETIQKYNTYFDKILRLSLSTNARKNSYIKYIDYALRDIKTDLIKPLIKQGSVTSKISTLYTILDHVTEKEAEYLEEAVKCANLGFKRASIMLGWCAAVSRLHSTILRIGFDTFNTKSNEMKNKTEGRYKRFKKSFSIGSLNELRAQVFDNDLLWIIEYMELIDPNEHDRLSLCFTMRNNCAHPGDAPLSEENLISFYSDIDNIIFKNPKFSLD